MLLKSTSKPSILIVDDVPDNLRLLAKMLESQGYLVRKSLNGRIAIQGAHLDPPDLILLDINMPEMNGYEVCQKLKASDITAHIPIIFISALDQLNDKIRAFEIGGQDYITKPFQELEVLARIKNQILIKKQQEQLREQQQQLLNQNEQLQQEIQERQRAEAEVQQLNTDLEKRVQARTLELQQSLHYEATLKRISDKVRDSLNQHQILQDAVEELAAALEVHYCDAVLYSEDTESSIIHYQYVAAGQPATQGQLLYSDPDLEVYDQLQNQKYCFAFCPIHPSATGNHAAILACPIFDERVDQIGIIGDLWLFKNLSSSFGQMEIHLVQQVANQCAIAIRQARLYEAAQAQVQELQKLNQLKDDFLSTISHELRSPIASMKMVLQLMTGFDDNGKNLTPEASTLDHQDPKKNQYLTILQEECDRELKLVEDLLSLQHLEAGTYSPEVTRINLQDWISHIIEPFSLKTKNQQQTLHIDLAPDLPTLNFDPLSLSRIITELLSNACKYTPGGGTIAIAVSLSPDHSPINKVPFLKIIITNTGEKIAAEELPRIFDKFYRIPNNDPWKYAGTGLGLALAKKLVEQMGGVIMAESADNLIQFTVKLPLTEERIR